MRLSAAGDGSRRPEVNASEIRGSIAAETAGPRISLPLYPGCKARHNNDRDWSLRGIRL